MSEIPDPIDALVVSLKADAEIAALVENRVFNTELPEGEDQHMPRRAIVVRPAGGPRAFGRAYQEWGDLRVDVLCYGTTPKTARDVWRHIHPHLKQLRREVQLGAFLHWARDSGGPLALRDPDTDWPYIFTSWQVLVAEVAASA